MIIISVATKRVLKALSIIKTFFTSIMGPNTMNASSEPMVKLLANDAAIKASADEQTEIPKAKVIIAAIDDSEFCPIFNIMSRDTKVWASAAKAAPIIKYLPISKNSSQAFWKVFIILVLKVGCEW